MKKNLIILFVLIGFYSCASSTKSVALGGAIGAGSGAVLGGIIDPSKKGEYRTRNVIIGSSIGGMAGMIAGSALYENTKNKKQAAFDAGKKSVVLDPPVPSLQNPKVETRWIESRVIGNRYVEGHYEHVIVGPTRWEASNDGQ